MRALKSRFVIGAIAVVASTLCSSCYAGGPIIKTMLATYDDKFQHTVKSPTGNPKTLERGEEKLHLLVSLNGMLPADVTENMVMDLKVTVSYGGTDYPFTAISSKPLSFFGFKTGDDKFKYEEKQKFLGKPIPYVTFAGKFDWKNRVLILDYALSYRSEDVNGTLTTAGDTIINHMLDNNPAGYFVLPLHVQLELANGQMWEATTNFSIGGLKTDKLLPPVAGNNHKITIVAHGAAAP
jgi:hypothetical protein